MQLQHGRVEVQAAVQRQPALARHRRAQQVHEQSFAAAHAAVQVDSARRRWRRRRWAQLGGELLLHSSAGQRAALVPRALRRRGRRLLAQRARQPGAHAACRAGRVGRRRRFLGRQPRLLCLQQRATQGIAPRLVSSHLPLVLRHPLRVQAQLPPQPVQALHRVRLRVMQTAARAS